MRHLCPTCQAPLSAPLLFRADLRFCASCLSVIRLAQQMAGRKEEGQEVEMTGAAMLRLRDALKRDPSLRRALARDPQRYWQLQLLRDRAITLQNADEVQLVKDAQIQLRRPRAGRNYL